MKKTLSFLFLAVVLVATLCVASCTKSSNNSDSSDFLAGTTWSGQVTYKFPKGAITYQNTLYFKEGKCYSAYFEEEVPYTLDKDTASMKFSGGSCTFVVSGNSGVLSGTDEDVVYQGTLTKQ